MHRHNNPVSCHKDFLDDRVGLYCRCLSCSTPSAVLAQQMGCKKMLCSRDLDNRG